MNETWRMIHLGASCFPAVNQICYMLEKHNGGPQWQDKLQEILSFENNPLWLDALPWCFAFRTHWGSSHAFWIHYSGGPAPAALPGRVPRLLLTSSSSTTLGWVLSSWLWAEVIWPVESEVMVVPFQNEEGLDLWIAFRVILPLFWRIVPMCSWTALWFCLIQSVKSGNFHFFPSPSLSIKHTKRSIFTNL